MRKKRKLRVRKFNDGGYGGFDGTESLGNEGFGSVGLGGSSDTGPGGYALDTGKGFTGDSITNFGSNYAARSAALGLGNLIPGATAYNVLGAARDTAVGRAAMNMGTAPTTPFTQSSGEEQLKKCPPEQVLENGNCVVKKLSGGGTVSLEKKTQLNYYKDLL